MKRGMLRRPTGALHVCGIAVALAATFGVAFTAQAAVKADYPDFSDTSGLKLNGDATQAVNVLRLTSNGFDETGTAFTKRKVLSHKKSFKTEFSFSMHDSLSSPGDGMAFVVHSTQKTAIGAGGGGLGFGFIGDSVAVEFDTFDNGGDDEQANEVAIITNGKAGKTKDAGVPTFQLYGSQRWAWVSYKAKSQKMKVWVNDSESKPSSPIATAKANLKKILEGKCHAGFTAATGGATEMHDVISWKLTQ